MSEIQRKDIIEDPANKEEMIQKYEEQQRRGKEKVREVRNARDASDAELVKISKETLRKRAARQKKTPLENPTPIIDPKSKEVKNVSNEVLEQSNRTDQLVAEKLKQMAPDQAEKIVRTLKGRVKEGPAGS